MSCQAQPKESRVFEFWSAILQQFFSIFQYLRKISLEQSLHIQLWWIPRRRPLRTQGKPLPLASGPRRRRPWGAAPSAPAPDRCPWSRWSCPRTGEGLRGAVTECHHSQSPAVLSTTTARAYVSRANPSVCLSASTCKKMMLKRAYLYEFRKREPLPALSLHVLISFWWILVPVNVSPHVWNEDEEGGGHDNPNWAHHHEREEEASRGVK